MGPELARFIVEYSVEIAALGRACVAWLPHVMLIYDNDSALAVGFGPSERASRAVFSLAFHPSRVNLCLLQGGRSDLKGPHELLQGTGRPNRFITLKSAEMLAEA